jgi:amidase
MRRLASLLLVVIAVAIGASTVRVRGQGPAFNIVEATILDMQAALESRRVTSRQLVQLHMDRIARYEDQINAVAYLSRTALDEADVLDRERASGRVRGPLPGIPIAVKDIINTTFADPSTEFRSR